MSKNDITGDKIKTKPFSKDYESNYDKVFRKQDGNKNQLNQRGSVCHQQLSELKTQQMEPSTWMCNLRKRSITTVLRTKLSPGSSSLQIKLKVSVKIYKEYKQEIKSAMGNDWLCASDIADKAGIQHRSAIKILINMALNDEVEMTLHEWSDERMRQRKRRMYRIPDVSPAERAELLNKVLISMRGRR